MQNMCSIYRDVRDDSTAEMSSYQRVRTHQRTYIFMYIYIFFFFFCRRIGDHVMLWNVLFYSVPPKCCLVTWRNNELQRAALYTTIKNPSWKGKKIFIRTCDRIRIDRTSFWKGVVAERIGRAIVSSYSSRVFPLNSKVFSGATLSSVKHESVVSRTSCHVYEICPGILGEP